MVKLELSRLNLIKSRSVSCPPIRSISVPHQNVHQQNEDVLGGQPLHVIGLDFQATVKLSCLPIDGVNKVCEAFLRRGRLIG